MAVSSSQQCHCPQLKCGTHFNLLVCKLRLCDESLISQNFSAAGVRVLETCFVPVHGISICKYSYHVWEKCHELKKQNRIIKISKVLSVFYLMQCRCKITGPYWTTLNHIATHHQLGVLHICRLVQKFEKCQLSKVNVIVVVMVAQISIFHGCLAITITYSD